MAKTILVVDDDAASRYIYRRLLASCGYTVVEAEDGASGLLLVSSVRPDLIITDLGMPVMTGWEMIRHLKSDPSTAGIPVLALTVYLQPEDEAAAWDAGCDNFLAKPCHLPDVVSTVERLLDGDPLRPQACTSQ